MEPADPPVSPDGRNRLILRRTLSAVSWVCAALNAMLGLTGWSFGQPMGPWVTAHAAVLGLAGFGLWRPRGWGWPAALLAAAASTGFVLRDRDWQAAVFDGLYPVFALLVLGLVSRRPTRSR